MQRIFIIDRDFFTGLNVAQCEEEHVAVEGLHVSVRRAGVVDVVRAVAAATAIQAPLAINVADAQLGATSTATSFNIRNTFAGVFGNLAAALKANRSEATFAVDGRLANRETGRKFQVHAEGIVRVAESRCHRESELVGAEGFVNAIASPNQRRESCEPASRAYPVLLLALARLSD